MTSGGINTNSWSSLSNLQYLWVLIKVVCKYIQLLIAYSDLSFNAINAASNINKAPKLVYLFVHISTFYTIVFILNLPSKQDFWQQYNCSIIKQRIHISNSTYNPVKILTNSVFSPLNLDLTHLYFMIEYYRATPLHQLAVLSLRV